MINKSLLFKKKNGDIKFSTHGAFWNNLHQVHSKSKGWKAK